MPRGPAPPRTRRNPRPALLRHVASRHGRSNPERKKRSIVHPPRQTQEGCIEESVSQVTQKAQKAPQEVRTPLAHGHSTEIPAAVDVQMQGMALRGPAGESQPGLESQGRAASMPRLAAETQ
ncbi:Voltage-dependent N-type calcium channel subunit alpha-1B, partial [Manis javanica]